MPAGTVFTACSLHSWKTRSSPVLFPAHLPSGQIGGQTDVWRSCDPLPIQAITLFESVFQMFGPKIEDLLQTPMNVAFYMRTNSVVRGDERINKQFEALKQFMDTHNPPWKVVVAYRGVNQRNIKPALVEIGDIVSERGIPTIDAILVTEFARVGRSQMIECTINGEHGGYHLP